MQSKDAEAIVK